MQISDSFNYSPALFVDSINRGGLCKPTQYAFLLGTTCWEVFEEIKNSKNLTQMFLSAGCHRYTFEQLVDQATGHELVTEMYCFNNHNVKALFINRFFNCISKNLAKRLTNEASDYANKKRKVNK